MVTSDPKLAVGTVVLGDVRVDELLDVAGLGAIHRGRILSRGAPVLVRVMRSDVLGRLGDRFERELSIVRLAEHAGVVAPLHVGIERDLAIVVHPGGELLSTKLRSGSKMALSEVGRIVTELAEIIDHTHRETAPLVHGALSSSSIVLDGPSGNVRLLDLGIVQALERIGAFDELRWNVLSPASAAPELVTRTFPLSEATDVFGLASIAFECLTGRAPFPATSAAEAHASIVAGKRPSSQALRSELHPDVDKVLATAWSVDPRSRPHEASGFANALAVALARSASRVLATTPPPEDPDDDGPTLVHPVPAKPHRALTLPFGIKTNPPRTDPPPPGPTTVPRMVAAETIERAMPSAPPPPQTSDAPVSAPPLSTGPRESVHVVSVTAVVVSLIIGSTIVLGAGLIGGSILLARRAPSEPAVAPAPTAPAPAPTPSAAPIPSPSVAPAPAPSPSVAAPLPSVAPEPKEPEPPTLAASTALWPEMPKELGPRPSPKALDTLRARLKTAFDPCLKMTPKPPPGMPWMVHFELDGPSGRPVGVEVSKPYKGTLAGACLQRAALDARVPPFESKTWSIDLRFGPT